MAALVAAAREPSYPAEIAVVLSNKPDAQGIERAAAEGIATGIIDPRSHPGRAALEAAMTAKLVDAEVEIVCLAGFMRVLSAEFVERWRDRLINIHPSLLPSYPGLDTHARALETGVKLHGCTVHYVRAAVDAGPIIAQAAVAVRTNDTVQTLATRVLAAEHRLYTYALALVASGRARVVGERVEIAGETEACEMLVAPRTT